MTAKFLIPKKNTIAVRNILHFPLDTRGSFYRTGCESIETVMIKTFVHRLLKTKDKHILV